MSGTLIGVWWGVDHETGGAEREGLVSVSLLELRQLCDINQSGATIPARYGTGMTY